MNQIRSGQNEVQAEKAFSKQASVFDGLYSQDTIIRYKRDRVRAHVNSHIKNNSRILELNAGTGEDALYFAGQGHRVHATDISAGMLDILKEKVQQSAVSAYITQELCSYTSLPDLSARGPYDLIFSNFAGLNCTNRLDAVLASFAPLLEPGGMVTLVVLPKFCLWELMMICKGRFATAFRRFGKGVDAHIEGEQFRCWYYDPSYITQRLEKDFSLVGIEGLCTIVPPSYIAGFAEKYPRIYRFLCRKEDQWKSYRPWRSIGDYYIISLRKK